MSFPLDPSSWLPDEIRRQIFDGIVDFIGDQTETLLGKRVGDSIRKLTTNGDFIAKFDSAILQAQNRFSYEYSPIDLELVDAILQDKTFWQSTSIRHAIMTIIRKPGAWAENEKKAIIRHFDDVFPNKFDHNRINKAINSFLRCLAQELWHLPALQHVYELQLQQYTAEQLKEVTGEIRELRTELRNIMALPDQDILELESGGSTKQDDSTISSFRKTVQASLMDAPPSPTYFVDRSRILTMLEHCLLDTNTGLVGIIGWGGMGKTSVLRYWIDQLLVSKTGELEGVFWWSFPVHNSIDELLESLLIYIGIDLHQQLPVSAMAKIQLLGKSLINRRLVVVLDGIEVMQIEDPHLSGYGNLKSPDLKSLLSLFADWGTHTSKIVITSRIPLIEFTQYSCYLPIDIEALAIVDGIELLQKLGVMGENRILGDLARKYGGHPLTLTLLATYLVGYADGLATRTGELPSPLADTNRYEAVHRILEHYDKVLSSEERAFLMVFSVMRSTINQTIIEAIFRQPGFQITQEMAKLNIIDFKDLIQRLIRLRLIQYDETDDYYTIHPIVREFYAKNLENFIEIQKETFMMLCNYALTQPVQSEADTLENLAPRIDAIHYACSAKNFDQAFYIWHDLVQQKRWAIQKQFGALELDIELIELFLPDQNWHSTPHVTELKKQAILINQLGYILNRLGRTTEAVLLLLKAGTLRIAANDWENAACSFFDLADAKTHIGDLTGALSAAEQSIELARLGPPKRLYSALACFAWVNFLFGKVSVSSTYYQACDALEAEIKNNRGSVYLADRVHQVTYLIRIGSLSKASKMIEENIFIAEAQRWSDEITSCVRQLGDLEASAGNYEKALAVHSEALEKAKTVGRIDEVCLSLISRGKTLTMLNQFTEAEHDLQSALSICKVSQWHLHQSEVEIALGQLFIRQKRPVSQALLLAKRALSTTRKIGYKWAEADSLELFGSIAESMNKISRAKYYRDSALDLRKTLLSDNNIHR